MKQYINGYDAPRFKIEWTEDGVPMQEIIDISFKYKALREYFEPFGTVIKFKRGLKIIDIDHIDYEWTLSYPTRIHNEDQIKLFKVERATIFKRKITMWPHREQKDRSIVVGVLPEKKLIDLNAHFGGKDKTTNKGYQITLVNLESITDLNFLDPNTVIEEISGGGDPTPKGVLET